MKASCHCGRPAITRDLCKAHYTHLWRSGEFQPLNRAPHARWAGLVRWTPTCWLWTGKIGSDGYGRFSITQAGNQRLDTVAHRFGYQIHRGSIPEGLVLDHLCRVRHCVNPWHLEIVTIRENVLRGHTLPARYLAQTNCKHGHPFDEPNTYRYLNKRTGRPTRMCRRCDNNRKMGRSLAA